MKYILYGILLLFVFGFLGPYLVSAANSAAVVLGIAICLATIYVIYNNSFNL